MVKDSIVFVVAGIVIIWMSTSNKPSLRRLFICWALLHACVYDPFADPMKLVKVVIL